MKNIGYADNAAILRSMVRSGACPNCYSMSHKDCTGDDDECLTCNHARSEHLGPTTYEDHETCQTKECVCNKFVE